MNKYITTIFLVLLMTPAIVFGQTESTVSKTITSYKGVKNLDSKVIKKSSDNNSLNVLLQVSLINAGYNPGSPDGVVGSKTIQAIKSMQKDLGISVDGVFGLATATALREFSDRFTNQKVSEVKKTLPQEFAEFKAGLKQLDKQTASSEDKYPGIGKVQLPTTPKGVLTYVLSKNQPNSEPAGSSSLVGSLVAKLTKKPKLATGVGAGFNTTIINPAGTSSFSGSSELDTNFNNSSATANTSYQCVTTSEHTESCTTSSQGSSSSSYYCRGSNCEVLGLTNKPSTSIEEYVAPTQFDRSIDVNERATWGQPVAFDQKTGNPTIYLKDYGYDPKNGKRNLSVIFVDLAQPVYNH